MKEHTAGQYSDKRNFADMEIEDKILIRTSLFKVPGGKTREEAFSDLQKKISIKEKEPGFPARNKLHRKLLLWIPSAAAGILILFGILQFITLLSEVKVKTGRAEHIDYILPDGSEIKLNAESRIRFTKKDFEKERIVRLEGEGFFNVTKGNPFRIITPNGEINILGTSLNILSRNNDLRVSCLKGKINVSSGNQSAIIGAGESAELSGNILRSFRDIKIDYVTGWINGEFYFENSPLDIVFEEIERQFNVKFASREKEDRYFTGSFTNKNLEEVLETVCTVMSLNYEIGENKKIYISSKE